ncbi:MAG: U32 family peptidase [Alphaproteobacteria bacterium]|jgi:O2-independent ubiquinone biosynthesis protein UbiV|nr:U32 family peptidase [Alphaproteobacteria bacterium]MBT4016702.1 U32 family peptidase [Alphaproteobacteria bacterium]MBT4966616.1 U32 family peptidase [Alphaproteobacteria bacterium]MBT5159893.1 U32 family peptidase [Alphaproteobacteria bacterium]MBT6384506.1 U32 family peptidase [Alphaproteobacteria bacterium]
MSINAATSVETTRANLTLGPILYNWSPEQKRDFYFRMADEAPVDVVYVGEVVCSKREILWAPVLPDIIARLQAAGKEVVFSTLALIMSERESAAIREIINTPDLLIEANDFATADLLKGQPHIIGPNVNVYNEGTLGYLADNGANRVCLPVELPGDSVRQLAGMQICDTEIQAWGRMPLAISARCYHARSHGLHKDGCQYVCDLDPDGLDVMTVDRQPFLTVNGTQTLSSTCLNLLPELDRLADSGVSHFRLSPQTTDMVEVSTVFRNVLDGTCDPAEGDLKLAAMNTGFVASNGFIHGDEGWRQIDASHIQ